jgi:hypothetical protein
LGPLIRLDLDFLKYLKNTSSYLIKERFMEIDLLGAFKLKLGTDVDAMYKSENFLLQISLQKALDDHSKSLNSLFCTEDSKMASRSLISEISGKLGYSLA